MLELPILITDKDRQKTGWTTPDGQKIEPDKNGKWPVVKTTQSGGTIVAGGDIPGGRIEQV